MPAPSTKPGAASTAIPLERALADRGLAITGGAGRIATALRPMLRKRYKLRLLDTRPAPADLAPDEEYLQVDVANRTAVEAALGGADAVLHLAANPSPAATWAQVRSANIDGTDNVFEGARRQGIGKVVFASTNHVMGFYHLDQAWPIDTRSPIRPDSLYGVSKAFGEALARYYSDAFDMSMLCLRIGWFTPEQPDRPNLSSLWISARDLAQIVGLCLDTPRRFGIYNATSNNPQGHWDLTNARDELGYAPQDDVSTYQVDGAEGRYVDPQLGVLGS